MAVGLYKAPKMHDVLILHFLKVIMFIMQLVIAVNQIVMSLVV